MMGLAVSAPVALATPTPHLSASPAALAGDDEPDFCQDLVQLQPFETTSSGVGVYDVNPNGGTACLSGAHHCVTVGSGVSGDEAGLCGDIVASASDGLVTMSPVAEGGCKENGSVAQCANVSEKFELADGAGQIFATTTLTCGHSSGSCAGSGERDEREGSGETTDPCGGTGTSSEVWTVILTSTVIDLPGIDKNVSPSTNAGSSHVVVCIGNPSMPATAATK